MTAELCLLSVADDIIRQHKMACLRVTSLLACRDQLWVGTSAGVILTLPLPKLSLTSTKATVNVPTVTGVCSIVLYLLFSFFGLCAS